MDTAIGRRLRSSPGALAAATAVGAVALASDFALVWWGRQPETAEGRSALAILALAAQVRLAQGDLTAVGLRLSPAQGWQPWARAALLIGLAVGAALVVGLGAWALSGREVPVHTIAPAAIGPALLHMCLFAPVVEETIYRLALCAPLAAWLGPWAAITASGLSFGALHVVYGNPSPENLIGGFFLAWAYLKSGSFAVPVLLHALGNLCALASQVGAWYWLKGAL